MKRKLKTILALVCCCSIMCIPTQVEAQGIKASGFPKQINVKVGKTKSKTIKGKGYVILIKKIKVKNKKIVKVTTNKSKTSYTVKGLSVGTTTVTITVKGIPFVATEVKDVNKDITKTYKVKINVNGKKVSATETPQETIIPSAIPTTTPSITSTPAVTSSVTSTSAVTTSVTSTQVVAEGIKIKSDKDESEE